MESKKIVRHINVGGDLGDAAEDAMTQAGINTDNGLPPDAVVINNSLLPSRVFAIKASSFTLHRSPQRT